GAEGEEEPRDDHVVGYDLALPLAEGGRERHVGEGRLAPTRRDRPEVLLHQSARLGGLEVAGDGEDSVVGSVVGGEEGGYILEARLRKVLHRSDQRVMERMMRRVGECGEPFPPGAVRLVVYAPPSFVLHHIAL